MLKRFTNIFLIVIMVTTVLLSNTAYADDMDYDSEIQETKTYMEIIKHCMVMMIDCPLAFSNDEDKLIDEDNLLVKSYIKNGRLLVPARFISEESGADIIWDGENYTVSISINDKSYIIDINNSILKTEDKNVKMDVAPEISNDRLFLPIRLIAEEILEKDVYYDNKVVIISDPQKPISQKYKDMITEEFKNSFTARQLLVNIAPNGYQGVLNLKGEYVIEPKYYHIDDFDFSETTNALAGDSYINQKWGIIDTAGNFVIEPISEYRIFFTEGLADVTVDGKSGYIDYEGNYVIEPQFEMAGEFHNGIAYAKLNGKYGYIDKTGAFVIEPQFEDAYTFRGDYTYVSKMVNGKEFYGVIDRTGNFVVEPKFNYVDLFSETPESTYIASETRFGGKYGTVNEMGEWVIKPQFDYMIGFHTYFDDYANVEVNEKYGIVDKKGNLVIEPMSDTLIFAHIPSELHKYSENEKYGYIDWEGNVVIPPQFDDANSFFNGLALVKVNDKYGYIDTTGEMVIEPIFEKANNFKNGLARVKINGLYNFINTKGKLMFFDQSY